LQVTIKLFALARQRLGSSEVTLEVPEPATVARLRQVLAMAHPELAPIVPALLIAVAAEYARDETLIPAGAEVAAIPPVSGGGPSIAKDG
jgi:molybdopterin converting factor subunit 1